MKLFLLKIYRHITINASMSIIHCIAYYYYMNYGNACQIILTAKSNIH